MKRRYLQVRYDVTGWSKAQIACLQGEALAIAEAIPEHPTCLVLSEVIDHDTIDTSACKKWAKAREHQGIGPRSGR